MDFGFVNLSAINKFTPSSRRRIWDIIIIPKNYYSRIQKLRNTSTGDLKEFNMRTLKITVVDHATNREVMTQATFAQINEVKGNTGVDMVTTMIHLANKELDTELENPNELKLR